MSKLHTHASPDESSLDLLCQSEPLCKHAGNVTAIKYQYCPRIYFVWCKWLCEVKGKPVLGNGTVNASGFERHCDFAHTGICLNGSSGRKQFLHLATANHKPLIPILVLCLQLSDKLFTATRWTGPGWIVLHFFLLLYTYFFNLICFLIQCILWMPKKWLGHSWGGVGRKESLKMRCVLLLLI